MIIGLLISSTAQASASSSSMADKVKAVIDDEIASATSPIVTNK
jgi:hypothetical protein